MPIPSETAPDSTLALLREGYEFVARRCAKHGSDLFRTRVAGVPIVCMSGPDASRFFYEDPGRFTRRRAIPRPTMSLLQDFGSVAGLDDEPHRHRKAMFLSLLGREGTARMAEHLERQLDAAIGRWARQDEVVLDDAIFEVLGRAVCAWAGVPLDEDEARTRGAQLADIFEGAGSVGPRQLRGQLQRRRTEAWVQELVGRVRRGELRLADDAPLGVVARHRGLDGGLLTDEVAAVEVLNLLRPTVAVGRFITFCAHALHAHPQWRERLADGGDDETERFALEVRRTYPFFPLITGRARTTAEWAGHAFAPGDWVMLDIYGTNRDPRAWERPDAFEPERFAGWAGDPFALIAQGGGDHARNHRCAGEWATIALMQVALRALTQRMDYEVPEQDLSLPMWRMPSRPRSGFVMRRVRRRTGA